MSEIEINQDTAAERQIILHRIYVKSSLFEAASYNLSFIKDSPEPMVEQQISVNGHPKENDLQEAVLTLQLTAKYQESLLWRIQLQQAGLYTMKDFTEEQKKSVLYGFCMNQLYPYACTVVTQMITQAGFPPIYLTPMNFEQLYQQQLKQNKTEQPLVETI